MDGVTFSIDQPSNFAVSSHIVRVSGWIMNRAGEPAETIQLLLNDEPAAAATRALRLDVGAAWPGKPLAANSGFLGDVVLDPGAPPPVLSIRAVFSEGEHTVSAGKLSLPASYSAPARPARRRTYELASLYSPEARDAVMNAGQGVAHRVIDGVPHFHATGDAPLIRIAEHGSTHGYPKQTLDLIKALSGDQIFLDLGCGIRPSENILPNGIYLDAVHFPGVDIVNSAPNLPFKDESIDLVVSHAVFEHLRDPRQMARELWRILKPGGAAYIDTAFMQPFHGDPSHYFNMTTSGLRAVFEGFEFLWLGVSPWQTPSWGWRMQLDAISGFVTNERWAKTLAHLNQELALHGHELDETLGPIGRDIIAAGVSAHVRKPA